MDNEKVAHDIAIALLQASLTGKGPFTATSSFEAAKEYLAYYKQALNSLSEENM